jgi:hypothetical protein
MMLFILTYDRRLRELVSVEPFAPGAYEEANRHLAAHEFGDPNFEVVLLEAASLEDLRLTHRRYFEKLAGPLLEPAS